MGLLDNVKKAANAAKEQAGELAGKHGDKIDRAIDKGGSMIDQRTHGKYSDKIVKAQGAARNAADKVAGEAGPAAGSSAQGPVSPPPGTGTPPPPPPPGAGTPAPPPPPPPPASAALTSPVREFVDAVNAHDETAFLDSFGDTGVVDDWGREFVGREAIKEWSDKEFIGANGTMDVQQVTDTGGQVRVVADWRSSHANGLSEFTFDTAGHTINRMTIRGAH
ncbi:Rv0909 family putative TA system antitoxin [Ornithinimicrobium faecis]|uniref:Rv0909 family putative TA system antitoxin n=1 Tax=Ornithinimicrobium faecis TaxID=2934158 RepID=UPI00211911E7|nr:Rv0909 family putative TA system antitoxin [Ornithinimicrobium sp. HY1745]